MIIPLGCVSVVRKTYLHRVTLETFSVRFLRVRCSPLGGLLRGTMSRWR
jgi:hypothetical protein